MEGSGCGYHMVDTPNCPLVLVTHHNRPERQEGRMGETERERKGGRKRYIIIYIEVRVDIC